ncbi:amino acid ABC transporter permease [Oceanobacillus massiliensis]|uniref:amino acid ABC transporter permease n=2 Tax=Oceanobacillus massiliensis TaxID=1465765 RepID=UPI000289FD54|nr:ABC transporter permease subunit [Oceanobacillus massiliensis]
MKKENSSVATPFWRDKRIVPILLQLLFVIALIFSIYFLLSNTLSGLNQLGMQIGFDFLSNTSGFTISESILNFQSTDTYGKAILVGILNTLKVAFFGIILATIIGIIIGIARLSKNWLVSKLAFGYVEIFRNTPLLVQMFIWYFAVFLPMPQIEDALKVGPFYLTNRGTAIPWFEANSNSLLWGIIAAAGIILAIISYKLLMKKEVESGKRRYPIISAFGILIIALGAAFITTQSGPFQVIAPSIEGKSFIGGNTLSPGFSAVLLGLVIYTSTFIAEIIRAGIMGVSNGQKEATKALGLKSSTSLRLVVFPQAIRIIIPPLTSQYLNLTKNSSLAVAIGYQDIVSVGNTIMNQTGRAIEAIIIMIAVYLTISLLTSLFMNIFNKRMQLVER